MQCTIDENHLEKLLNCSSVAEILEGETPNVSLIQSPKNSSSYHEQSTDEKLFEKLSDSASVLENLKGGNPETSSSLESLKSSSSDDNNCIILNVTDSNENPKQILLTGKLVTLADGSSAFIQNSKSDRDEIYTPFKLTDNSTLYVIMDSLMEVAEKNEVSLKTQQSKVYSCSFENCSKTYSNAFCLKVHTRVHTGERPFKCPSCENNFSTNYGLKVHIRTHNNERPFQCNYESCPKSFKTSGDLLKHTRIHTGDKPFLCPVAGCGRTFTTSNVCKVHIRCHTGERPYHCQYPDCGKTFSSVTNHRNHLRIHNGDKPYACSQCERKFSEYSTLYKHRQIHDRKYSCDHCSVQTRTEQALRKHLETVHSVPLSCNFVT